VYIGHYSVALGAKKAAPRMSLGTLFFAAAFVDLLMSLLMLTGVEHLRVAPGFTVMTPLDLYDYPFSHSLAAAFLWAASFAAVYFLFKRSARNALTAGFVVLSHWALDFITHTRDLPLFPGSPVKVGLGIWNHPVASIVIEATLFAAGMAIYLRCTKAKDKKGLIGFWFLMIFLLVTWIAGMVSPPPPDAMALAIGNQFQWLVILAACWIDRHRETPGAV
jgi:hypothetical protein